MGTEDIVGTDAIVIKDFTLISIKVLQFEKAYQDIPACLLIYFPERLCQGWAYVAFDDCKGTTTIIDIPV